MAALLLGCELVLEVHARGPGLDHRLHELERVQRAAEAGLGVRDERHEPVDVVFSLGVVDLVGTLEDLLNPANETGNAVRRVEALVGIHLSRHVGVGGDLPTADVDGPEAGLHHLHPLIAAQRAEGAHERCRVHLLPELRGPIEQERAGNLYNRASQ